MYSHCSWGGQRMKWIRKRAAALAMLGAVLLLNLFCSQTGVDSLPEGGLSLSLQIGSHRMLRNGEPATIPFAPIQCRGIPLVPLAPVIQQFGGTTTPMENGAVQACVALPWQENSYQAICIPDAATIQRLDADDNQNEADIASALLWFYPDCDPGDYQAILYNGELFVPPDYFGRMGFATVDWLPDRGVIIISSFETELQLAGYPLRADFNRLPVALRQPLHQTKDIPYQYNGYMEQIYQSDDLTLLLATQTGSAEQSIRAVTLRTNRYATPRGLRVGDSESRFQALYGRDTLSDHLQVELENGKVKQITLRAIGG